MWKFLYVLCGFPGGSDGKESACSAGCPGLIPGLGRSPGEGHSNPLQYSRLENSMDRGAWELQSIGVPKSQTQLSYYHTHTHIHTFLEKHCDIFEFSGLLITLMDMSGYNVCHPINHYDWFSWFFSIVLFFLHWSKYSLKAELTDENVSLSDREEHCLFQGPSLDHLVSISLETLKVKVGRNRRVGFIHVCISLVLYLLHYIVLLPTPPCSFSKIVYEMARNHINIASFLLNVSNKCLALSL